MNRKLTNTALQNKSSLNYFCNSSALICAFFLILFAFTFAGAAQNLPNKIRGYKVYNADVSVRNQTDKPESEAKSEAIVKIGEPKIVDFSLTRITLELSAEIQSVWQSGKVDFVSFKDFRINDLAVEAEEYKESFAFTKNKSIVLPKPVKIYLSAVEALRGARSEIKHSKAEWTVTGTIFVFGRFKKFGFNFKRVVPIEINLKIKNPLLETK